jgi:chemotaxis protein CheC
MNGATEELRMDALREVANVGAASAARALSQLMGGEQVLLEVPRVLRRNSPRLGELLGGLKAKVVAASFEVTGALKGELALVWSAEDAARLGQRLAAAVRQGSAPELAESALAEAANIMASACLSAVGHLVGMTSLPSVPKLWSGPVASLTERLEGAGGHAAHGLVLETRLDATQVTSELFLLPDGESMDNYLGKLGL